MKKIILIILVFVLSACSLGANGALKTNQAKWKNSGITHYRFDLFIGCFCAFRDKMPLHIEVQDGEVVSMTYTDGTPAPTDDQFFNSFATLDRIFLDLTTGTASKADEVKVEYDPTYGYPTTVNVDQIKAAMDDEYALTVSNFEVMK